MRYSSTVLSRAWLNLLILGLCSIVNSCQKNAAELPAGVQVLDSNLELSVFATSPDIVTPIGIAVRDGRVYVLESHTHSPPAEYEGPPGDRIKVFSDEDGDGVADLVQIYAEGFEDGMNLQFAEDGRLFLVCAKGVWVISDEDGDGIGEQKEEILSLVEPESVYDHAALLGVALDGEWMYISRGNTGGDRWKLVGTDGSFVQGIGDGGNVVRSRLDGSQVEEIATGFWNPFSLTVSAEGRLLAIDNDPDSRGPNKLVEVIPGADFGYKSIYGGSGIHPYLAWNGELPGTLPYAAALGEAPSGIIDAAYTALPADYGHSVLVSIWEESKIVRVDLQSAGVSVKGVTEDIIQGNATFRPVAFSVDEAGVVYFTDWVRRTYPNHNEGRIWRLQARRSAQSMNLQNLYAKRARASGVRQLTAIQAGGVEEQLEALDSEDPYIRATARYALQSARQERRVLPLLESPEKELRIEAALVLMESVQAANSAIPEQLLKDEDEEVRRLALRWIGRNVLVEALPDVQAAIEHGQITPDLFDDYLATIRHLQPAFVEALKAGTAKNAKRIPRRLPNRFLADILHQPGLNPELRALALLWLQDSMMSQELVALLHQPAPALQHAAIWKARIPGDVSVTRALVNLVTDDLQPDAIRIDALLALGMKGDDISEGLVPLLQEGVISESLQLELVRYLSRYARQSGVMTLLEGLQQHASSGSLRQQISMALGEEVSLDMDRLATPADLKDLGQGNAELGKAVFYSFQAQCANCHQIDQRGGTFGPDLSNIGQSKSPVQILNAILFPSAEISPEWQGWFVEMDNGERHVGRQIDVGLTDIELMTMDGSFVTYKSPASYGVYETSLMPEGLHKQLTERDVMNLVAYLSQEGR